MTDPAAPARVTVAGEASRYTAEVNLSAVNDAHVLALGRVPARSDVLDLGAADGSMAAVLKAMGCRVWAVEIDPAAAESAKEWCEEVLVADLNDLDLAAHYGDRRFDAVLMLDVLEHLPYPEKVLRSVSAVLAPQGWGVISIPNVAHISARLQLLKGKWTYTETGLLDETHLRFFDRDGIDDLLAAAGWAAFDLTRVTRRLGTTEIQVDSPDPALVAQIEAETEALTYQFVLCAAPEGSPVLEAPPPLPAAVAQRTLLEAFAQVERLQADLGALSLYGPEAVLPALEGILAGSDQRRQELYRLLAELDQTHDRVRRALSG